MKVKHDDVDGDQEVYQWGRCIVLKGTSESQTNESEKCDKKPRHCRKEPNENVGKKDDARECNVSEDKSRDLEAHVRCTGQVVWGTNGT